MGVSVSKQSKSPSMAGLPPAVWTAGLVGYRRDLHIAEYERYNGGDIPHLPYSAGYRARWVFQKALCLNTRRRLQIARERNIQVSNANQHITPLKRRRWTEHAPAVECAPSFHAHDIRASGEGGRHARHPVS